MKRDESQDEYEAAEAAEDAAFAALAAMGDREVEVTAGYADHKATVTISYRLLWWVLTGMTVLGFFLGALGLRAAFAVLPPREDHIVVVAMVAMVAMTVSAFIVAYWLGRRSRH